jgi:hypothetical protein
LNIRWCTFDQYQSKDTQQILRQEGFATGLQSIDESTNPYDFVKNALYDRRISMPKHVVCERELISLERDVKKNKIDHPPHGSKDVSDALAGVVFGLTMRREVWGMHRIPLGEIPPGLLDAIQAAKNVHGREQEESMTL